MIPSRFLKIIFVAPAAFGMTAAFIFGWLLLPERAASDPAPEAAVRPEPDLSAGKEAFEANCARCHGDTGAGDGPDARRMVPHPRNLAEGVFKFRTTISGTVPTDEDLFHTISTGLPGSRMPDFQRLPEDIRWQLVYYVKSLSPAFQDENQKPERVDLGSDPGPREIDLQKGKELYAQLGCIACHGNQGRGDGPSAPTLIDNRGEPIKAADLTQGWNYRGGSSPKEITARFLTGIDGTPMPSYADAVESKQDAWTLAYYVHSLQQVPEWKTAVEAVKTASGLPTAPDDAGWDAVPRSDLRLSNIYYQGNKIRETAVNAISVQAVYNEEELVLRLRWHDPVENRQAPPDAAAVVLLEDRAEKWKIGSLRSWPASKEAPAMNLLYWSADRRGAREAVSRGTAPVEAGQVSGQECASEAVYKEGEWSLIVRRPFRSSLEGRVEVRSKDNPVLIGFMVWEGYNGEKGRHRANSSWVSLILK